MSSNLHAHVDSPRAPRRSRRTGFILAAVLAVGVTFSALQLPLFAQDGAKKDADGPQMSDLGFMVGAWGNDTLEEHWSAADNGVMMGMARLDHGKMYEFMLTEQSGDGTIVMRIQHYKAQLKPTEQVVTFRLAKADGKEATFEFLENDFPARIVYSATSKDQLQIRLEDKAGQRKLPFALKRIATPK